jgi:hypothetical protein
MDNEISDSDNEDGEIELNENEITSAYSEINDIKVLNLFSLLSGVVPNLPLK